MRVLIPRWIRVNPRYWNKLTSGARMAGVCSQQLEVERTRWNLLSPGPQLMHLGTILNPCCRAHTLGCTNSGNGLNPVPPHPTYGGQAAKGLKKGCGEWGSIPSIYRSPFGLKFPFWPSFYLLSTLRCVRICFLCVRIGDKMCLARHSRLCAYASSPYAYAYRTIIYRCEALDVSFPMALESSHVVLYSASYAQFSDKKLGLTALGEFGRDFLIESLRTRQSVQHESSQNKPSKWGLSGPYAYASQGAMRMHLALGGTPKWRFQHLCECIQSFYAYA
ncbi:hypothetical protein PIB30_046835 [Stylosanthes scabra]|uniref:Uncharacterized protein n=1 Tax=Stylosanthes scabra TaxID=79078 RepID=A0ABU6VI22_9FABA|nr:hypothetical protein [Stylosanthes scabra]